MSNPFDQNDKHNEDVDPYKDKTPEEIASELVGEGKKYKTTEEAIRALAYSQHHITRLESDNAALREAESKAKTIDEVLAQLRKQEPEADKKDLGETKPDESKANGEDVEATVKRLLAQHQSESTTQSNRKEVIDTLAKVYGDKAGEVWDNVERQFKVDLEQMSAASPAAALQLLGVKADDVPRQSAPTFGGDGKPPQPKDERPPEGSKRLADYLLARGEITRQEAYKLKLKFSADPDKFYA